MGNYRQSAYCTYGIKYHIIWITKTSVDGKDCDKDERVEKQDMPDR